MENKEIIYINEITYEDIKDVLAIYHQGIMEGHATFQTELPSVEEWDKGHLPFGRVKATNEEGKMLGWIALTPTSNRCCYKGVADVSIYIDKDARKKGIGEKLIQAIIEVSESNGIWTLQSGIFDINKASLALHTKCGFRTIGYRERVAKDLHGVWRDVVLMEKRSQNPMYL